MNAKAKVARTLTLGASRICIVAEVVTASADEAARVAANLLAQATAAETKPVAPAPDAVMN